MSNKEDVDFLKGLMEKALEGTNLRVVKPHRIFPPETSVLIMKHDQQYAMCWATDIDEGVITVEVRTSRHHWSGIHLSRVPLAEPGALDKIRNLIFRDQGAS